ncbi:LuxR C-terminal-related transcriptional regulator [Maricurvus nonylphenolicus]
MLGLGNTIAWLSLDIEDNTPHRFLTYLTSSLNRSNPGIGEGALALLQSGPLIPAKVVISILINELANRSEQIYLVLDDYQVIHDASIHAAIDYLIQHASDNVHLVISSRSTPAISIAKYKGKGFLTELNDKDLRFEIDECRQFILANYSHTVSSSDIQRLYDITEGWVTGLQLAIIPQTIHEQDFSFKAITSDSNSISNFMSDVVLAHFPNSVLDFLLSASILDRFNASLCDAVTGRTNSYHIINELLANRLFIQSLDDDGNWFRFHNLFSDHLKKRLIRENQIDLKALHQQAQRWFADNHLWAEAVRHALAAGNKDDALTYIDKCAMTLVESSNMVQLMEWANRLSESQQLDHFPLHLAEAWSLALLFKFQESHEILNKIERDIHQKDHRDRESITFSVMVIRVLILGLSDQFAKARALGNQLLDEWPKSADLPFAIGVLCNVVSFAFLHEGDYEQAQDIQLRVLDDGTGQANMFVTVYRKNMIGLIALRQGKFKRAHKWFQDALHVAEKKEGRRSVAATMSACLLAKIAYEENNIEISEQLLADRQDIVQQGCFIDSSIRAYQVMVRIQLYNKHYEVAQNLLLHIEQIAANRGWLRMLAMASSERIRIALEENDLRSAASQLGRLQEISSQSLLPASSSSSSLTYWFKLAEVRVLIATSRLHNTQEEPHPEYLEEAIIFLESLIDELTSIGNHYATNEVRLLLSLSLDSLGKQQQAMNILGDCLEQASLLGLQRSFLDEGLPLYNLLIVYKHQEGSNPYLDKLLALFHSELGQDDTDDSTPTIPTVTEETDLSQRERDVLVLIEKGCANKEIARLLEISLGTVKWHVKNIYKKLRVSSRTQAINEAKNAKLI